jgi:hypothetical protein
MLVESTTSQPTKVTEDAGRDRLGYSLVTASWLDSLAFLSSSVDASSRPPQAPPSYIPDNLRGRS